MKPLMQRVIPSTLLALVLASESCSSLPSQPQPQNDFEARIYDALPLSKTKRRILTWNMRKFDLSTITDDEQKYLAKKYVEATHTYQLNDTELRILRFYFAGTNARSITAPQMIFLYRIANAVAGVTGTSPRR